jgi:hypothetical protein
MIMDKEPINFIWPAILVWLLIGLLFALVAGLAQPASAQTDPTQTPTPTATEIPTGSKHQLTSGSYFEIQRSLTYGEIAIVVAIMLLMIPVVLYVIFRMITHYIY